MSGGLVNDKTQAIMSQEEAQKKIFESVKLAGKFLLSCNVQPDIGEIKMWAGLPMRVVRHVSYEEMMEFDRLTVHIWPGNSRPVSRQFHFQVEVAD